jgi:hypothetical protein
MVKLQVFGINSKTVSNIKNLTWKWMPPLPAKVNRGMTPEQKKVVMSKI